MKSYLTNVTPHSGGEVERACAAEKPRSGLLSAMFGWSGATQSKPDGSVMVLINTEQGSKRKT